MRPQNHRIPVKTGATLVMAALLLTLSAVVFAVDGVLTGGKSSKSSLSTLKKDMKMPLRSGFSFQDNRTFPSGGQGKADELNSVMSVQKGNVTLYLPSKSRSIVQKFKTPAAPAIR